MSRRWMAPDVSLALCVAVGSAVLCLPLELWFLDVAASLQLHVGALSLLFALSRLSIHRWWAAALWAVAALLTLPPALLLLQTSSAPLAPGEGSLRIFVQNVHTHNRAFSLTTDAIKQARPDIFAAIEVDETWATALAQALQTSLPHSRAEPRSDNFGIALYSRIPIDVSVIRTEPIGVPSISAVTQAGRGGLIQIIATHPIPPLSARWWDVRNRHIAAILQQARASSLPTLIVGDLNLAPTSPQWARLIGPSGWRRVQVGSLPSGTWPSLLGPAGITIDHVLVGEGIVATGFSVLPSVGSDHRGIVVDIRLEP